MVFGSEDSKPLDDLFQRFYIGKERDRPKRQGFGKVIEGFADEAQSKEGTKVAIPDLRDRMISRRRPGSRSRRTHDVCDKGQNLNWKHLEGVAGIRG